MPGIDWKRETAVSKSVTGTRGRGNRGRGDLGTRGRRDVETRRLGESGRWGGGEVGTRGLEDVATHFYHLLNFSSYFTKSSSVDRNCVVPRF